MSRFVNLASVERVDLGPCQCEGSPHDSDWVEFRAQAGYEDLTVINRLIADDPATVAPMILRRAIRGWNLQNGSGEAEPVSPESIARLDPMTSQRVYEAIDAAWVRAVGVPNAPGARSRATSRVSASQTRPTRKPTTS